MRLPLAILFLCASCMTTPRPEQGWVDISERAGILVSARGSEERSLPEFRAVAEVEADIYDVLAVLVDVPRHPEWMAACGEARVVKSDGRIPARWIYNRTDVPAPMSLFVWDRDVVVRAEVVIEEPGEVVRCVFVVDDPELVELPERVVRTPRADGFCLLKRLGPGRTHVEYQVDADPGGGLPEWVKRLAASDLPMDTILGLRRQVAKTSGEYDALVGTWREAGFDPASLGGVTAIEASQ